MQYASTRYRRLLDEHGMRASMSRTGDCYDNAPKESSWATLKKELLSDRALGTREEARGAVFEYIAVFYSRQRTHGSIGDVRPEQFEAALRWYIHPVHRK